MIENKATELIINLQSSITNHQSKLVGLDGVEPSTSRLSGVRSNQAELQAPVILDFGLQNRNPAFLYLAPNSKLKNPKSVEPIVRLFDYLIFREQILIPQN